MTRFSEAEMVVLPDPPALAARAAAWLLDAALGTEGPFAVALSGGSTPRALYALLAQPPYLASFPWARTHWFWGDERFVPHDDPESNYRMVREALLSKAPIPAANVHAIPTEGLGADAAAKAYEGVLKAFYRADALDPTRPLFDVQLLGLGPDGHTASLFPGQPVLEERIRWAAADLGPGGLSRITLTYPVLESSRRTAFLIAGAEKRDILARLRAGADDLPAARLRPEGGLRLFVDAAAAS
jgi:6-phosphogluconolactonase